MISSSSSDAATHGVSFLPDFCRADNLLRTVIIAQLLAFVLVAARPGTGIDRLFDLGILSLAIQWIALADVALLCLLRGLLRRLDRRVAAVLAFALLQLVTVLFTLGVHLAFTRLGFPVLTTGLAENLVENLVISAIVTAVGLRYFYGTARRQQNVRAEAEARVQALQARIRPHFLFNSMNTIASLTRSNPADAERAVEDLSELFRASMGDSLQHTLAEELALIRSYLRIEQQRLGLRLCVTWTIDEACLDARLPALSLQPLVENAIYHGIERLPEGGEIHILAEQDGGRMRLTVENPIPSAGASSHGQRMALDNVRQRLDLAFPHAASLRSQAAGDRYRVMMELPMGGSDARSDRG